MKTFITRAGFIKHQFESIFVGLTLATEEDANSSAPIYISALLEDGLAERTKTVQINDQLVEINGVEVKVSFTAILPFDIVISLFLLIQGQVLKRGDSHAARGHRHHQTQAGSSHQHSGEGLFLQDKAENAEWVAGSRRDLRLDHRTEETKQPHQQTASPLSKVTAVPW